VVLDITALGERKSGGVPTAVSVTFIANIFVATSFALLLCKPKGVCRKDGTAMANLRSHTQSSLKKLQNLFLIIGNASCSSN